VVAGGSGSGNKEARDLSKASPSLVAPCSIAFLASFKRNSWLLAKLGAGLSLAVLFPAGAQVGIFLPRSPTVDAKSNQWSVRVFNDPPKGVNITEVKASIVVLLQIYQS
jgi:hypothetical protein